MVSSSAAAVTLGPAARQSLLDALQAVPDPRGRQGRLYPLAALLTFAVAAMLCGTRSLYAIAQWGRDHGEPIRRAVGLTRGRTPSVATLHRVFTALDRAAFEAALTRWLVAQGPPPEEAIALDGKTLRGIHGEALPGVHLVAAYAQRAGRVLAQAGGRGPGE